MLTEVFKILRGNLEHAPYTRKPKIKYASEPGVQTFFLIIMLLF